MTAHPEAPKSVWVDSRLAVRRSLIEGDGLFATEGIDSHVVVVRLGGRLVDTTQLLALLANANNDPASPYIDTITVFEDQHLVLSAGSTAHFANHSCDPNLWLVSPFEFATRSAIAVNDEITVDYGTFSGEAGFPMPCGCGTALCRGEVTAQDWRRKDLRTRYSGHWAPALQSRITRLVERGE